jgi:hypothetical protein
LAKWVEGQWVPEGSQHEESKEEIPESFLARFLHLLAALDKGVDSEAQTGKPKIPGMTWLPRPPKEPKAKEPLTNGTILDRIRITYPVLRASKVDSALR